MAGSNQQTKPGLKQSSKLLVSLFEGIPPERHLSVLDVGSGVNDTVQFFSHLNSHLYFADLYSEPVVQDPREDVTVEQLAAQFADALSLPADARFDICLFWDFFNYLDGPALQAFVQAVGAHMRDGARCHGFGMLNSRTQLTSNHYGIRTLETLTLRRRDDCNLAVYPHSQRELTQLLGNFLIKKSLLMVDGRLEFVLNYRAVLTERDKPKSLFGF